MSELGGTVEYLYCRRAAEPRLRGVLSGGKSRKGPA
jgi:hypothetical protein